jgi:hypothetical protein
MFFICAEGFYERLGSVEVLICNGCELFNSNNKKESVFLEAVFARTHNCTMAVLWQKLRVGHSQVIFRLAI